MRFVLLSLALVLFICLAWVVLVINPFEWGAVQSSHFSWERFEHIKAGDQIDVVVRELGEPISPPGTYRTNMPGGVLAGCGENSQCKIYKFAGTLLFGGREAIVITNVNSGRVLAKWVNREP